MHTNTYLMYVDVKDGIQSNKYYNMLPDTSTFTVEYGRVGSSKTVLTYPLSKWKSIYNSKVKKGYEDISHLKVSVNTKIESSNNKSFDEFFDVFSKYTGAAVNNTYLSNSCTKDQIKTAQQLLDNLDKKKTIKGVNETLLKIYKIIPRKMYDVNDHLIIALKDKQKFIKKEQDALDSMDSSNIIVSDNPYKNLNIDFGIASSKEIETLEKLIYPTKGSSKVAIHQVYTIKHKIQHKKFTSWLQKQENKQTQYLIHGTRNANVFSILKQGLRIRPSNAAMISGAAYGNGIYHSAHTAKSLNYVGYDKDKLFFIQNVHMGKPYTYQGWYRSGKDLDYSELTYKGLQKYGCDSLFVKPGDGLLNSEYIVFNEEQTNTEYLVWLK